MSEKPDFEKWWEENKPEGNDDSVECYSEVALAAWNAAIERTLVVYEKAFENNWVVQDTIDAIRRLKSDSKLREKLASKDPSWLWDNVWATRKWYVKGPAKVYDFVLSYGLAWDRTIYWTAFLKSNPKSLKFSTYLNCRAVFRWVACPDTEIFVPKGDRLVFSAKVSPHEDQQDFLLRPAEVIVYYRKEGKKK